MAELHETSVGELVLKSFPDPRRPDRRVRTFGDWKSAVDHLCNHVLTAPECDAWAIVLPAQSAVDFGNPNSRFDHARRARETCGRAGQPLYDAYARQIETAAEEAVQLAWLAQERSVAVLLGTAGLLVLIDHDVVKTAFLPGQGDPFQVLASEAAEKTGRQSVLPRERGMRRLAASARQAAGQQQARQRREAQWSPDERLYYNVFRPAVQFIRSRHYSARDWNGKKLAGGHYAMLKERLPRSSQLKIDHWRQLRTRVTAGRHA